MCVEHKVRVVYMLYCLTITVWVYLTGISVKEKKKSKKGTHTISPCVLLLVWDSVTLDLLAGKRKNNHPGLTDLSTIRDTPRLRVEKKIMKP